MFVFKSSAGVTALAAAAVMGSLAAARPDGSTVCLMTPDVRSLCVWWDSIKAPATYAPAGAPMNIQVTAGASIQGIVLYAENGAGSHVGSFAAPTGYKALDVPACKNEGPTSSLTHSGPAKKGLTATFQWTPPKVGQGPLNVRALVVTDTTSGFNVGVAKLTGPGTAQSFGGAGGAAPGAGADPATASNAPPSSVPSVAFVVALAGAVLAKL
ncbi:MAG: hypothetical protein BJ554DRAFT_3426 [Olpidium bornovanus]|uniref:Reelin domain-containing protein n=1 Tax=Olpidium bornovanus TaxID=278681 RepID=A0A8H7ZP78_9FUNG|nr:MAG: hypothetical protein BJ554DRAFT_3426 [Olpidium bornovanus]